MKWNYYVKIQIYLNNRFYSGIVNPIDAYVPSMVAVIEKTIPILINNPSNLPTLGLFNFK